ncbi:Uncharacterised protein [Yersinia pseudotuberculosis]|uniref:hypothetical protein n=1 Tax=Yersinia pseudotuberculosis TaxID=633 RepID=UPI0005DF8B70|nr:hypothetical protein [Yersinia pseudotuberculosis]CNC28997.1 Uncharacterised protein [Yersinia pseudotuberculosis]
MKELDSFTVEQLNDFIKSDHTQCGDVAALARIALAAKRAETVTWWTGPEPTLIGELESYHDHETGSHYLPLVVSLSAYNTTPQLNSPEIRKLILSEVSDFCAGLGQPGEPELPEDIQQALMNRIELVFNNCG